jgi:hypothetical protein
LNGEKYRRGEGGERRKGRGPVSVQRKAWVLEWTGRRGQAELKFLLGMAGGGNEKERRGRKRATLAA